LPCEWAPGDMINEVLPRTDLRVPRFPDGFGGVPSPRSRGLCLRRDSSSGRQGSWRRRLLTQLLTTQREHSGTRRDWPPRSRTPNRPLTCMNTFEPDHASTSWFMRRATHNPSGRGFESHPPHRILAGHRATELETIWPRIVVQTCVVHLIRPGSPEPAGRSRNRSIPARNSPDSISTNCAVGPPGTAGRSWPCSPTPSHP